MSDVLIALENIRTAVQSAASHLAAGVASRSSAVLDGNVAEVIAGLGKLDAFVAEHALVVSASTATPVVPEVIVPVEAVPVV